MATTDDEPAPGSDTTSKKIRPVKTGVHKQASKRRAVGSSSDKPTKQDVFSSPEQGSGSPRRRPPSVSEVQTTFAAAAAAGPKSTTGALPFPSPSPNLWPERAQAWRALGVQLQDEIARATEACENVSTSLSYLLSLARTFLGRALT